MQIWYFVMYMVYMMYNLGGGDCEVNVLEDILGADGGHDDLQKELDDSASKKGLEINAQLKAVAQTVFLIQFFSHC